MVTQEDYVVVGKVVKSHNLQGDVVIVSENDLLEKYSDEPVFIQLDGAPVPFFIADEGERLSVRNHNSYIVKFDFVDTLKQAERLIGCDVMLEKELLDEEDTEAVDYDVFQLNGFSVLDENTGKTGKVLDVADYSGNIVLSIDIFGKEILLPLSEAHIKEIDFEHEKLIALIPQDIIDLY